MTILREFPAGDTRSQLRAELAVRNLASEGHHAHVVVDGQRDAFLVVTNDSPDTTQR